ncbi:tetratricopeptide repeat protein [Vibrio cholerae]|nr:tetratricopeptide repeat protein [Vibrio cholerae]
MKKMLISLLMFLFYFLSYTCFANINSLEKHDDFELIVLAQDKMQDNQWEEAIKILRYSVAKHPKNNVLRLQLAISLFKNNEFNDSLKQLLRVRAAEKNKYILSKIDGYIDAIRGAKKTSYNIHLSYETDDNVNGVPRKNFGGWRFQTPKKDNYINYYLSSTSTLPISNGFGIRFDSTLYGKKIQKRE